MKKSTGRPALPGTDTTFALDQAYMPMVSRGTAQLAKHTNAAPSRAAWMRALIEFALGDRPLESTITLEDIHRYWANASSRSSTVKFTIRIEERQRILLRQFECYAQSLDWSLPLYRNEAMQLLIILHGPNLNQALA